MLKTRILRQVHATALDVEAAIAQNLEIVQEHLTALIQETDPDAREEAAP